MIQPVKFETQEDLFRFSELASKEDFPIYISTSYGQLDARSLLGLFTILGQDVNIVVGDHANADKFSAFLQKYANSWVRWTAPYAGLAQLDRVTGYEPVGRGFESLNPYHRGLSEPPRMTANPNTGMGPIGSE